MNELLETQLESFQALTNNIDEESQSIYIHIFNIEYFFCYESICYYSLILHELSSNVGEFILYGRRKAVLGVKLIVQGENMNSKENTIKRGYLRNYGNFYERLDIPFIYLTADLSPITPRTESRKFVLLYHF